MKIIRYSGGYFESNEVELTAEQQEIAEMIGEALAAPIIYGAGKLNEHIFHPWWKNSAKPWISRKYANTKKLFSRKTKAEQILEEASVITEQSLVIYAEADEQIEAMLD